MVTKNNKRVVRNYDADRARLVSASVLDEMRTSIIRPEALSETRRAELSKMKYTDYLVTPEWRAIREHMLLIYPYCVVCDNMARPCHVHHRHYTCPRGEEAPRDLVVLCDEHHALFHGRGTWAEPEIQSTLAGLSQDESIRNTILALAWLFNAVSADIVSARIREAVKQ